MRPFLIIGSTDKARYDHALQVAHQNQFHFIPLNQKEFFSHEKDFFTATLDEALCLFYIEDVDKLTYEESMKFLELIKDSPHRFMFSCQTYPNYVLQKGCLTTPIGDSTSELTFYLKTLLTEPNRDAVRLALINSDPIHLFHILKKDAWKSPEALQVLLHISQNIFKVHKSYIISLLAFALQNKPFALSRTLKRENKMEKSIISKIAKAIPYYTTSEVGDVYHLLARGTLSAKDVMETGRLELTDEEKAFLGIATAEQSQEAKVFAKAVEISEFF